MRRLAAAAPMALALAKRGLNFALEHDLESTLEFEAELQTVAGRSDDHARGCGGVRREAAARSSTGRLMPARHGVRMVVGVVGAGTMGAGIAQVALQAGHEVLLHDVDAAAIQRGRERIAAALQRLVDQRHASTPGERADLPAPRCGTCRACTQVPPKPT